MGGFYMLDIVSAIRKLCEVENGFVNLFKDESKDALNNICSDKDMVRLFSKLVHGKARISLIELISNPFFVIFIFYLCFSLNVIHLIINH